MELCLHQVRGRAARLPVTLRQCTREEAETVYRLQNEVRAMMPNPELFMPDTLENIQSYLEHDLCLGAWDGGRLGAYFILREHWANADSVIVHPDWRGNGLQRILLENALPLLRPGIVGIGATVSPGNPYSLNNAKASGFEIVSRREMYGGHDRYLLAKHL